jgi:hypothetical protein
LKDTSAYRVYARKCIGDQNLGRLKRRSEHNKKTKHGDIVYQDGYWVILDQV